MQTFAKWKKPDANGHTHLEEIEETNLQRQKVMESLSFLVCARGISTLKTVVKTAGDALCTTYFFLFNFFLAF